MDVGWFLLVFLFPFVWSSRGGHVPTFWLLLYRGPHWRATRLEIRSLGHGSYDLFGAYMGPYQRATRLRTRSFGQSSYELW